MNIPKDIRNQLAKTQGYLQKNDILRALESLSITVCLVRDLPEIKSPSRLNALEKNINMLLQNLCVTPTLSALFNTSSTNKPEQIHYQAGKESALATVLRELANILREQSKKAQKLQQDQQRLQDLLEKGQDLLIKGKYERGNAYLERAAHEFYTNSTVILYVADTLMQHRQHLCAMKILCKSLTEHPRNDVHYIKAMEAALAMPNYAQIEHIFTLAKTNLQENSPTLMHLAQLKFLAIANRPELERREVHLSKSNSLSAEDTNFDTETSNFDTEDNSPNLEINSIDTEVNNLNTENSSSDAEISSFNVEENSSDTKKEK